MTAAEPNIHRIVQLIRAHQLGELDNRAQIELNEWRIEDPANEMLFSQLNDLVFLNSNLIELSKYNAQASFEKFKATHIEVAQASFPKRYAFLKWKYALGAAAVLALVMLSILFFVKQDIINSTPKVTQQTDVAPGKVGATLTLADGKQIRLSEMKNGASLQQAGIKISKSASGQLTYEFAEVKGSGSMVNTLSTAKGETYKVRLPDGTLIWLNAASSLTYTANLLQHNQRVVHLDGEAYFEVAKDQRHPFVVVSNGQSVKVLGTHFNVNAYKDEPQIATTLLEGAVEVSMKGLCKRIKPGQQVVTEGKSLRVNQVNVDDVTDWKEGDFYLNHVDFKTAMRKIARWYDVEVVYDAAVPNDLEYGGWMSRKNNLSTVLKAIEGTGLAKFKIEGKKIYVYN